MPEHEQSLRPDDAHIGQLRSLAIGRADTPGQALNPDEVRLWTLRSNSSEEGAVAAAKIDVKRRLTAKQLGRVEKFILCNG